MTHIFILNPFAGIKMFADDLRSKLEEMPDLDYFIIGVRRPGDEAEVVRRALDIFEGEKLRFYVCGGGGTFQKVLNGFEDLDDIEIAYYPCGNSNDFIRSFGDDAERFYNIEELIFGDVINVDYIKTNHGVCINSFSFALDVNVNRTVESVRPMRSLGIGVPYDIAISHAMLYTKPIDIKIQTDEKTFSGKIIQGYFGNGGYFSAGVHMSDGIINDGLGTLILMRPRPIVAQLITLCGMRKKKSEDFKKYAAFDVKTKKFELSNANGKPVAACLDGVQVDGVTDWHVEIVHRGLHLIVPKGVRL